MLTYPADYNKVNEIIRRVAKKNGVMLIALNLEFKKSKEDINTYFDYDEHPKIKGYNKISEIIYSKIVDVI
jgi:lysophospholipase L1-like esterase